MHMQHNRVAATFPRILLESFNGSAQDPTHVYLVCFMQAVSADAMRKIVVSVQTRLNNLLEAIADPRIVSSWLDQKALAKQRAEQREKIRQEAAEARAKAAAE